MLQLPTNMEKVTFITGNAHKAAYMAHYLNYDLAHQKVDLDELQGLDLEPIIDHKVRQAYAYVGGPVIVEDVSLEFAAMNGFPGPLIKWALTALDLEGACRLLDGFDNRRAMARCMIGFYDGEEVTTFSGSLPGKIAEHPADTKNNFGWDRIFIPDGYGVTRAELSKDEDQATYLRLKPLGQVGAFLADWQAQRAGRA